MKKKDITREAIRRSTARSVRDSMALEGRVVPDGHVRSERVERFLEARHRRLAEERTLPDAVDDEDSIW
jgi:hypothetical protein